MLTVYFRVQSYDVLRAISLMILNTLREVSRPEDFLGHVNSTDFILVLPPSNLAALSEKLRPKFDQSTYNFFSQLKIVIKWRTELIVLE